MTTVVTAATRTAVYELSRDDRLIARVFVIPSENTTALRVAAEIFPVSVPEGTEPQWRFHDLPSALAARFVEETLNAFLYLGCTVHEIEPDVAAPSVQVAA